VERLDWLWGALVYWSGRPPESNAPNNCDYRPVLDAVAEDLADLPPGVYAVRVGMDEPPVFTCSWRDPLPYVCRGLGPDWVDTVRVTTDLLALAARDLGRSQRFPRALPAVVGDAAAWRGRVAARIETVRQVLAATAQSADDDPLTLAIEEECLWLGPDELRPTCRVHPARLGAWLRETAGRSVAGQRCGAIALRGLAMPGGLGEHLREYRRIGAAFAEWPPDVLCRCLRRPADGPRLIAALGSCPTLAEASTALCLVEHYCVTPSEDLVELVEALLPMLGQGEMPHVWPCRALAGLVGRVCAYAGTAAPSEHLGPWFSLASQLDDMERAAGQAQQSGYDPWREEIRELSGADRHVQHLLSWLAAGLSGSGLEPANVERLLQMLGSGGRELLEQLREVGCSYQFRPYGCLGRLSSQEVQDAPRCGYLDILPQLQALDPATRQAFLHWREKWPDWYGQLTSYDRGRLVTVFGLLGPRRAARVCDALARLSGVSRLPDRSGAAPTELVEVWSLDLDAPEETLRVLGQHPSVLEQLSDSVATCIRELPRDAPPGFRDIGDVVARRAHVLCLARFWVAEGHGNPERVVSDALERCAESDRALLAGRRPRWRLRAVDGWDRERACLLSVRLGAGDAGLVSRLFPVLASMYPNSVERILECLPWLGAHPEAREFLLGCVRSAETRGGALAVLLAWWQAHRLGEGEAIAAAVATWAEPPAADCGDLPEGTPPGPAAHMLRLAAYRSLAGLPASLPREVTRALNRRRGLQQEAEALERLVAERPDERLASRLAKIRRYLDTPGEVDGWVQRDLDALLAKHLRLARLQTLQGLLEGVLQARWRSLLGPVAVTRRDPDWANALALYAEVSRNRSLLQRLLRAEAQGDHEWARRHPANRAFLQAMSERGLDMGAWLDSHEVTRSVDGCPLRAVTETAPLRVLQMGSLFGTCLSPRGACNYSAVVNAVEINKRVLYVWDSHGTAIGRRLIVLSRQGELVGFRSYGAGADLDGDGVFRNPWAKMLLDTLMSQIARAVGCAIHEPGRDRFVTPDEADLVLFARDWYYDDIEGCDRWAALLPDVEAVIGVVEEAIGGRARPLDQSVVRAVLWLGEQGTPTLAEALKRGAVSRRQRMYLRKHTDCQAMRAMLEGG